MQDIVVVMQWMTTDKEKWNMYFKQNLKKGSGLISLYKSKEPINNSRLEVNEA